MMDYEKAYKGARERCRWQLANKLISEECATDLFRDIKENKDERIRKELLEEIEFIIPHDDETDSEGLILPSYHARIDRYKSYLEKQKEQKPAEWSEEDKRLLRTTLECLNYVSCQSKTSVVNWLKSLPERFNLQPKQEWSEEDEANFAWFDKFFRAESVVANGRDIPQDKYLWFKSLRPHPKQEVVDTTVFDRIADIIRWCYLPVGCPVENFKESESEREHLLEIVQCVAHRYANSCTYCKEYSRGYKDGLAVPHWKPSEYTLSLVKKVANGEMLTHMEQMAMETLCNDLQKLL